MPVGDVPNPDPTILTEARIERAEAGVREYVQGQLDVLRTRLDAIDEATKVLSTIVNKVPSETEKEVGHLSKVVAEKIGSIAQQFDERDIRSVREAELIKVALDAAFAAQKEAAAEQNKANQKAIDKSEEATNEAIVKLSELFETRTAALADKVEDIKDRVQGIESGTRGERYQKGQAQVVTAAMIGWASLGVLVLTAMVGLVIKFA